MFECPESGEVRQFVENNDVLHEGKLKRFYNFSRVVSLCHFKRTLEEIGQSNQKHVGVISGSLGEPELKHLNYDQLSILSYEQNRKYDLDLDWEIEPIFSLTMCNQVLEHVFNPHVAFSNICKVTKPNGLIYVSIPAVNCIHGEPYYYSSGFHPRYLKRLGEENDCELIRLGAWGSRKYLHHALAGTWLTMNKLGIGIRSKSDINFPQYMLVDGKINQAFDRFPIITDTWALFQKEGI